MKIVKKVVACFIENDGYVLCGKRKNVGECALKWEFPGGKVEDNETFEEALKREIKEELDLEINVKELLWNDLFEYSSIIIDLSIYKADIVKGNLSLHAHDIVSWIKIKDILNYEFCAADEAFINEYLIGKNR